MDITHYQHMIGPLIKMYNASIVLYAYMHNHINLNYAWMLLMFGMKLLMILQATDSSLFFSATAYKSAFVNNISCALLLENNPYVTFILQV